MAIVKGKVPTNRYEKMVFDVLMQLSAAHILDDEYIILPNIHWLSNKQAEGEHETESDIIMVHPQKGILVIEIKGSESKGAIQYNAAKRRFLRKKFAFSRDPLEQVQESCTYLKKFLQESLEIAHMAISPLLWFPTSARATLHVPPGLDLFVLSQDECDDRPALVAYLQQVVYGSPLHAFPLQSLDKVDLDRVIERLYNKTSHRQTEAILHARDSDEFRKLLHEHIDPVAENILRTTRCNIVGGAGTGKTVLAYGITARLQNAGLQVILACTHDNQRNWLLNEDHFQHMYPTSTPIAICKAQDLAATEHLGRYDAIIIDEAQDVENDRWAQLRMCLKSQDQGILYAFRDDMQRESEEPWNARNLGRLCPQLNLALNLRNPQAIYKRMRMLNDTLPIRPNEAEFPEGKVEATPVVVSKKRPRDRDDVEVKNLNAILAKLTQKEHVALEDILLISCRTQGVSTTDNTQSRYFAKGPSGVDVPFQPLSSSGKPGYMRLTTIRAAKGLESDVVILVELDGIQKMGEKTRRRRVYTAISRTRSHLIILGNETEIIK